MKKFFSKIFKKPNVRFITFNADYDWQRLFFIFVGLVVLAISWSGYVFWTVETESAFHLSSGDVASSTPTTLPSVSDISAVKKLYGDKASRFSHAMNSAPNVVDPSL